MTRGTIADKNSWIADKAITPEHVTPLTECARARWKIENENNNILKNYGYRIEHNFGRKDEFYNALRTFFWAFEFQTWEYLLFFVIVHARGG